MPRMIPLVLALFLAVACDSSGTEPTINPVGTYALILVNNESLPYVVETADGEIEILAGQFIVFQAGTCTGSLNFREVESEDTDMVGNTCTWTRTGSELHVQWTDGSADTATIQGDRITLVAQDLSDLSLVFER